MSCHFKICLFLSLSWKSHWERQEMCYGCDSAMRDPWPAGLDGLPGSQHDPLHCSGLPAAAGGGSGFRKAPGPVAAADTCSVRSPQTGMGTDGAIPDVGSPFHKLWAHRYPLAPALPRSRSFTGRLQPHGRADNSSPAASRACCPDSSLRGPLGLNWPLPPLPLCPSEWPQSPGSPRPSLVITH